MKFKYDTSTAEGKAQVMLEFDRTKKPVTRWIKNRQSATSMTTETPVWDWHGSDYNYPLEPKLVPWTLEAVPKLGVLFRFNNKTGTNYYFPSCFTSYGVKFNFDNAAMSYKQLLESATHSLDGGVTWQPCGRVE